MGNAGRNWLDAVRGTSVLAVAVALRLKTAPARGASGGSIYGCPACGAERRHESRRDRRGALGVRHDGAGFRCMDCDLSGDAIDLVALVLRGKRFPELSGSGTTEVREWFERYTGRDLNSESLPPPPAPPPAPIEHPPEPEVRAFYDRCVAVDFDPSVNAYLRSRHLRPGFVAGFDLARALPADFAELPRWASRRDEVTKLRVPWTQSGHRLIVPLYDARGLMRSMLARAIVPDVSIKSFAPAGYSRAGLLMACPFARYLLSTGQRPDWFGPEHDLRVVVAEGEIDFLTAATQWSDAAEHAPATLGIVSGSWSPAIAARIPATSTVIIATDPDVAGERYAAMIAESLEHANVNLKRWEPRA